MRRLVLLMLLSIGVLLVLASSVALAQDNKVELVLWAEGTVANCFDPSTTPPFGCVFAEAMVNGFMEQHPNITIKVENHGWDEELRQAIVTAELAGTGPDIAVGESFVPALTASGTYAEVDLPPDMMKNLIPGPVAAVTRDGKLYGVSGFTAVFALEVNADVVRKAGLDPDTLDLSTWSKVTEVAKQINAAGAGQYYGFSLLGPTQWPVAAQFRVAPYLYQNGGAFCDESCTAPTFNTPAALPVYEWFRELYALTPPGLAFNGDEGFVFSQLFSGLDAMQTAGTWHIKWGQDSGCTDCRYLPLPLPDEGGQRANVVVSNVVYSVLESSKHKPEGMEFLKWILSDDVQQHTAFSAGRLPTTYSALEKLIAIGNGDTSLVPVSRDVDAVGDPVKFIQPYLGYADELQHGNIGILPPWTKDAAALNGVWNDMFGEILTSDRPIQEILDDYQSRAEAIANQ
jgi:ABC-type glycerol-3-phosphate transport system substrate-binding protein